MTNVIPVTFKPQKPEMVFECSCGCQNFRVGWDDILQKPMLCCNTCNHYVGEVKFDE